MDENKLIKSEQGQLQRLGIAISVTNKLLALAEPQLIPYRKKDKWGFCTLDKKIVIECLYDTAYAFTYGLAGVRLNKKFGFIDNTGRKIIPLKYDFAHFISKKLAIVNIIDTSQKYSISKYGVIDKSGNEIIPCIHKEVGLYYKDSVFTNGLFYVDFNDKTGYINEEGQVVKELNNNTMSSFQEILSVSKINGKFGYVDKSGKVKISIIFDYAYPFSEGLALVSINRKYGFIDFTGKIVIPFIYDFNNFLDFHVTDPYFQTKFSDGLAPVKLNQSWGSIDKTGKVIIPFIYSNYIQNWNPLTGLAHVGFKTNSGYINKQGVEYWED